MMAVVVGVVSGYYIFNDTLRKESYLRSQQGIPPDSSHDISKDINNASLSSTGTAGNKDSP
jgi:hypothetical protein